MGRIESRITLSVVNHRLGDIRRPWRQLCVILAAVVRLVVFAVAAAQRVVVAVAIDGIGGATGPIRGYLIGVGAHCGGHLGARCGQNPIAQGDVL